VGYTWKRIGIIFSLVKGVMFIIYWFWKRLGAEEN